MTLPEDSLAPNRRPRRPLPAERGTAFTPAEVAHGTSDALLGAIGRMMLKIDLLAKQQQVVMDRLDELQRTLDDLIVVEETAEVPDDVPDEEPEAPSTEAARWASS